MAAATVPMKRGARDRKPGRKRLPSEMPMKSCPRFTSHWGSADGAVSVAASSALTTSGPITQAFGEPIRPMIHAPAQVAATSSASPG